MNNTVKTKKSFNYHWINTRSGEALNENDQIFTYNNSSAEIKLKSGAKIHVTPNSLISLKSQGEQTGINIENGLILADLSNTNEKIKVDLGGEEVELSSKDAQLQITKQDGKSKIEIIKGEVILKDKGNAISLKQGQLLSKKNGKLNIDESPINLLFPINGSILREQERISFDWKSSSNKTEERVFISKYSNFKKYKITKNNTKLRPGVYYWKVSSKEKESGLRMFRVLPETTTYLEKPQAEEILILNNESKVVHFNWKDEHFNSFDFELTGPEIVEKKNLNSNFTSLSLSTAGSYKWRIRPTSQAWSEYRDFDLSEPFLPSAPIPSTPKNNEIITLFGETKSSFRWTGERAANYHVQISKDIDFKTLVSEQKISSNVLLWAPKSTGTYHYRVRQLDSLSRETAFSKTITFKVDLIDNSNFIPKAGTKIVLSKPKEKVTFKWKESSKFNNERPKYFLEVSKTSDFNEVIITKETFSNNSSVTFPTIGDYFWRTKVIYPNQKETFSSPQKVIITPTPAPSRPVIEDLNIEIKVNSILKKAKDFILNLINILIPSASASELNTSARITWKDVENSKNYILEIYKDKNLNELILSVTLDSNSYTLNSVREGTYFWRIATIDHWDRQSEFSNLSKIVFSLPRIYKEVPSTKLLLPKNHALFKGKRSSIRFKWKAHQGPLKYSLLISKNKNFSKLYVKRTIETNKYNIRLSQGQYYWKIVAKNQFGYESESTVRKFLIKEEKVIKKSTKTKREKQEKKRKRRQTSLLSSSNFFFQYEVLSSSFEQSYSTYSINADGIVFSSFKLGNFHIFNQKSSIETTLRRFSGQVYNDLSYGVLSFQSIYGRFFFDQRLKLSIGASINSYTSYLRSSGNIQEEKNSSLGIPLAVKLRYNLFSMKNETTGLYSLGDLSHMEIDQRVYFKNSFSIGLGYESYSAKKDSSEIKMTNVKTSIRYQINY